jgi:hypothetical protein
MIAIIKNFLYIYEIHIISYFNEYLVVMNDLVCKLIILENNFNCLKIKL